MPGLRSRLLCLIGCHEWLRVGDGPVKCASCGREERVG
jgi:hypothetical protein